MPGRIENINDERRQQEAFTHEIFVGKDKPLRMSALMDTGATGLAYIDFAVAGHLCAANGVSLTRLARPIPVSGFNGAAADLIKKALYLPMRIGTHYERLATFYVTKIARHSVIIGKEWMRLHGVMLDTTDCSVIFKKGCCQHEGMPKNLTPAGELPTKQIPLLDPNQTRSKITMLTPVLPKKILVRPSTPAAPPVLKDPKPTVDKTPTPSTLTEEEMSYRLSNLVNQRKTKRSKKTKKGKNSQPSQTLLAQQICMINGPAFRTATKQVGTEIFAISMKEILEQKEKEKQSKIAAEDLKQLVPKDFHDFLDVFSAEEVKKSLPPHREKWDHKIQLKEGEKLPKIEPLRRLSPDEQTVLKEYLTENLNRAWITPSTAEYASPILFVKKPNGGIRLCVDYRGLNSVTKKNQYPLPLIDETIAKVVKAKVFTKFDIIQAFHNLRMREEDEDLTTFTCRFGTYKYRVLPFGLCGGPSTFQQFMNDNFLEFEAFVSCYVDDLIVFSDSLEDHKMHVRQVLERLRNMGIYVDILKSEFFKTEVKYLGLIIAPDGVKMDPKKVEIIKNWPKPKNGDVRAVRRFIGFVNFYRRFVRCFSKIARPLNDLLKKDSPATWTQACDEAFERIKQEVSKEPTMAHFDMFKDCYVECDSSDSATGGVLSQLNSEGALQPVAFFSKSLGPAERNYAIYDKEMLAIIRCFEEWKPELMSASPETPIQVLTDHKALEYFMTTKQLTRRQARWAEELSQFNFKIMYRPGAKNSKADLLTRHVHEDEVSRAKLDPHLQQTLLKPENLSQKVQRSFDTDAVVASMESDPPQQTLEELVTEVNKSSPQFSEIRQELETPTGLDKLHGYRLEDCTVTEGVLYHKGKILVPQSLLTRVISVVHSGREVGHAGVTKTVQAVGASYAFLHMDRLVRQFCRNCYDCLRTKPVLKAPSGLLQPLPIPERPWTDISVDFVVQLPTTKEGNNAIMVVVDRLSKERHYIPCRAGDEDQGLSAEATAQMFYTHIWRLHGLPSTIVSDRGSQFVNRLWTYLCQMLQITAKLSTAFHPQTDGQTEAANKEMERYLRTFVNYYQDNWDKLCPSAEFAINASKSETTRLSPFMATRGCQPRMSFEAQSQELATTARDRIALEKATSIVEPMKEIWDWTKAWMSVSQQKQKHYTDLHRRQGPAIELGDLVWLDMRNMRTERPSKKLDSKREGPFEVLSKVGNVSYKLKLPESMKVHPVFHKDLLAKHSNDPLPGQEYPRPGPVTVANDHGGEDEWEVEDILDVKKARGRGRGVLIRASWVGHPPDLTYYPDKDFEGSAELLRDFYRRNPTKPRPVWLVEGKDPIGNL